jgi:hypothetical protein
MIRAPRHHRGLAGYGLALLLGCGHESLARHPLVLRDETAMEIPELESLRELQHYTRRHTLGRGRARRSDARFDAASEFWSDTHDGWPFGTDPVWGVRSHELRSGGQSDTSERAKAVGRGVFVLRCGELSAIDVEHASARRLDSDPEIRWSTLVASGDTLVASGLHDARDRRRDSEEVVRAFALDAEGVPQPSATIELRVGGQWAAFTGHTSVANGTLVLVRRMKLDQLGRMRMPAIRVPGSRHPRWRPLLAAHEIQRSIMHGNVLHMVIRCDLTDLERSCTARAVLGDSAVAQHVAGASYLWMIEYGIGRERAEPRMAIVRLPHDGSPATAVRVPGMPLRGLAWRARVDGSIDAVIRRPRRDGAPGYDLALMQVDAAALREGVSQRVRIEPDALVRRHVNGDLPIGFVEGSLLWADRPWADCEGPTVLRSHRLADGTTQELEVPGCIDLIDGGATGVLLTDWTTFRHGGRMWPLVLEPTLQLGEPIDVEDAISGTLELARPARTYYRGQELWVLPLIARSTLEPRLAFLSQSGTQLREHGVTRLTPVAGSAGEPCDSSFEPPRVYGEGERLVAALRGGTTLLELAIEE